MIATFKLMKPRSMSNRNEPKARIIRPICGNIADLAEWSYLISSWIVVHRVLGRVLVQTVERVGILR